MSRRKVISKKKVRVAPDREEEIDVEEEVEEIEPPKRPSNAETSVAMTKAAEGCADCIRMAPRRCAKHKFQAFA